MSFFTGAHDPSARWRGHLSFAESAKERKRKSPFKPQLEHHCIRAAAWALALLRLSSSGDSRSRMRFTRSTPAFSGEPESKGGCGSYSSMSWIDLATSSPASSAATVRPKSMPAVTPPPEMRLRSRHHALGDRDGAEILQHVAPRPVAGRLVALEQAGRAQHQRAGAHRGDVARPRCLPAQEVERLGIGHQRHLAAAARHADHVELRALGEGRRGHDREAGIGRHRIARLPDHVQPGAGHAAQHLGRPGGVELRDVGIEQDADLDGPQPWLPPRSVTLSSRGRRPRDLYGSGKVPRCARDDSYGCSDIRHWQK